MARIKIYTDRQMLARGLAQAVSSEYDVEVLGLEYVQTSCGPQDAVMLDAGSDPRSTESRLVRHLVQRVQVPVVFWERTDATEPALNALLLGVQGILLDTSPPGDVMDCLETILDGGTWVPPTVARAAIVSRHCKLTRREGDLMTLIAGGHSNKEIAYRLGIGVGTVKVYFSHLFRKLGVSDRHQLAMLALRNESIDSVFVPQHAAA